ncbi:YybH family protein [Anaeromyxobacter paludicola]|uniref:DUF4440 domain-containing protein n=1 Tax=Anaeromyxobacter paludicola TaxID=2918171 RepID=A0ABM7XBZ3_9BACT|nr:nuclear transport factor 2 family protein [Anaeromyxobacter paludicola]BDG09374.1 hypothetical protein AMPC_24870 [Anaeromyxobacter paludicola]
METIPSTGEQQAGQRSQAVDPSLEAACRSFNEDFNRHDPAAVAAHFAEDATLITPGGELGRGRDGVAEVFGRDARGLLEGTRSTFTIRSARMLGQDLALLDLDHDLQGFRMPDGSRRATQLHVMILARRAGQTWQWLDARPYAFLPPPQRQ